MLNIESLYFTADENAERLVLDGRLLTHKNAEKLFWLLKNIEDKITTEWLDDYSLIIVLNNKKHLLKSKKIYNKEFITFEIRELLDKPIEELDDEEFDLVWRLVMIGA